jgi:hypothetical protein
MDFEIVQVAMAAVSDQLIWEIVKKNNSFLVKEFGRGNASVQFSKESNNLYNLNSYKHSGTCLFPEKIQKKKNKKISLHG